MTWMLTVTGAQVDLRLMEKKSLSLLDIAHALAKLDRFTGHCTRPYSVAEHSLLVAEIMERELQIHDPAALLAGLMHDAHEAYIGDLSTPLKQLLGAPWALEEARIQQAVLARFGLVSAYYRHERDIKRADLIALATERRDLMPPGGPAWPAIENVAPIEHRWQRLNAPTAMHWKDWREEFVQRFGDLYEQHNEELDIDLPHPVDARRRLGAAEPATGWHFPE
jgi:uncharacterized protein